MCAQACVTFCASMHAHAFKGKRCPSCKYAYICKCPLPQQTTHTHTQVEQRTPFSSAFSDPSERRTNILMASLCLRDAFEFLPSSVFPFPLFPFFSLLVISRKAPWFPESTTHYIWMLPCSQINTHWSQRACWWLVAWWLFTSRSKAFIMSQRLWRARAKKQTAPCPPFRKLK